MPLYAPVLSFLGSRAARSIPQKGFGKEEPGLQKKLEDFFDKYGKTSAVRMRRMDGTKEFKVRPPAVGVCYPVLFSQCTRAL